MLTIMGATPSSSAPPSRELVELDSIIFRTRKLKTDAKHFSRTLTPNHQCQCGQREFCAKCNKDFYGYLHLLDRYATETNRILYHFKAIFQERGWDVQQMIQVLLHNQDQQRHKLFEHHPRAGGVSEEALPGVPSEDSTSLSASSDGASSCSAPEYNTFNTQAPQASRDTSGPQTILTGYIGKPFADEGQQTSPQDHNHGQEDLSSNQSFSKTFPELFKRNRMRSLSMKTKIKHAMGIQLSRCLNASFRQNRNNSQNFPDKQTPSLVSETIPRTHAPPTATVFPHPHTQPPGDSNDVRQASSPITEATQASLVTLDSSAPPNTCFPYFSLVIQFENMPLLSKSLQVPLPLNCTKILPSAQPALHQAVQSSLSPTDEQKPLGQIEQSVNVEGSELTTLPDLLSTVSNENIKPSVSRSDSTALPHPPLNKQLSSTCQASLALSSATSQTQTQNMTQSVLLTPPQSPHPPRSPLQPPPPPPPPSSPSPSFSLPPPPPPMPSQAMLHNGPPPPPPPLPRSNNLKTGPPLHTNYGSAASLPGNAAFPKGAVPYFCTSLPRPSTVVKRLAWMKLNQTDTRDSIWKNVVEILDQSSSSIDREKVESLFGQTVKVKQHRKNEPPKTVDTEAVVSFLDSKTSLNLSVALKSFKMPPEEVAALIKDCNMDDLQPDRLRALATVLPDDDLVVTARQYEDMRARLSVAEVFCLELTKLPLFRLRVQAMVQADEILPNINRLMADFKLLLHLGHVILNSVSIRHFLGRILELGNFLNTGSYAGNAAGFHLHNLEVVWTTRATNSHVTLLQYLVENEEHGSQVLSFTEDLKDLRIAVRLSVSDLVQEVETLKKNVTDVSDRLQRAPDELKERFKEFVSLAASSMVTVETLVGRVEELRVQLATYFCENSAKYRIEDCIAIFHKLCTKIDAINEENATRRHLEEQRQQRLQESDERKERRNSVDADPQITCHAGPSSKSALKKALLEHLGMTSVRDQLMEEIEKGDYKLRKTTPVAGDGLGRKRVQEEDHTSGTRQ